MLWFIPIISIIGLGITYLVGFRGHKVDEDETVNEKLWRTYPINYPSFSIGEKIHWHMSQPTLLTWLFIIPFTTLVLYTVRFLYIKKK